MNGFWMPLLAAAVLGLSACAGQPPAKSDAREQEEQRQQAMQCEEVRSTGSHMRRRLCRTPEEIQAQRDAAQNALRKASQVPNSRPGGN